MCNDILVIGPSDGVVCENKDFLNWLEQAQKRSLVKFQMSSKQPSFARMPRNRGHLFGTILFFNSFNAYQYATLLASQLHCRSSQQTSALYRKNQDFAKCPPFLGICAHKLFTQHFTRQLVFYLLSNMHFIWKVVFYSAIGILLGILLGNF